MEPPLWKPELARVAGRSKRVCSLPAAATSGLDDETMKRLTLLWGPDGDV
jgi:hypothetical protein